MHLGTGGLTPRDDKKVEKLRSILANWQNWSGYACALQQGRRDANTHDALFPHWRNAISDPDAPASHHVGQHHVCGQSVPDDGNLRSIRHAGFGMSSEVTHNLGSAARLLHCVRQHVDPSTLLYLESLPEVPVPTRGSRGVGYYQELSAGICPPQLLKMFLCAAD